MSRYLKTLTIGKGIRRTFYYGFDQVLGYWYEIRDDHGNLLEEKDSLHSLRKLEFVEILDKYGVDKKLIEKAAIDLPI